MKKSLLIVSLLSFSLALLAQEEEQEVKGVHPYKLVENETVVPEYAHWSLIPHVGFNAFDGDLSELVEVEVPRRK